MDNKEQEALLETAVSAFYSGDPWEATALVPQLVTEIRELRSALWKIVEMEVPIGVGSEVADWMKDIALDALPATKECYDE